MIQKLLLWFLTAASPLTLSAFEPAKPFPSEIARARYVLSEEKINKGIDIPMGAHVDEDLRLVFSGHQKGNNVSILFGLAGVLTAATVNEARGAKAGKDHVTQEISVPTLAETRVLEAFEDSEGFRFDDAAAARFEVIPYVFLTKNKGDGSSKLHAMLKVKLYPDGASKKPSWLTRFFGEATGLVTDEELLDHELLGRRLDEAFQRAAWGMHHIINDKYDTYLPEGVHTHFPGFKNDKIKLPCIVLSESNGLLLLRFPLSKLNPLAGYTIVDQRDAKRTPMKKVRDKYKDDFIRQ